MPDEEKSPPSPEGEKEFDPAEHLTKIVGRGGDKLYLPVAARVIWFRRDYPISTGWRIETELLEGGFEAGFAVFRCTIYNPEGQPIATSVKAEDKAGFGDFYEKSETGSIGRALAACGYGTLAAMDEGDIVDAPQSGSHARQQRSAPALARQPTTTPQAAPAPSEGALACAAPGCGVVLTKGQFEVSQRRFKKALCPTHQRESQIINNPAA